MIVRVGQAQRGMARPWMGPPSAPQVGGPMPGARPTMQWYPVPPPAPPSPGSEGETALAPTHTTAASSSLPTPSNPHTARLVPFSHLQQVRCEAKESSVLASLLRQVSAVLG